MENINITNLNLIIEKWIIIFHSLNYFYVVYLCENDHNLILQRLKERNGDSFIENNIESNTINFKFKKATKLFYKIKNFLLKTKNKYSRLQIKNLCLEKLNIEDFLKELLY